jgi:hypothetical protein
VLVEGKHRRDVEELFPEAILVREQKIGSRRALLFAREPRDPLAVPGGTSLSKKRSNDDSTVR